MKGLCHGILAFLLGTSAGAGAGTGAFFLILGLGDCLFAIHNRVDPVTAIVCTYVATIGGAVAGGLGTFIRRAWAGARFGALALSLFPIWGLLTSDATHRIGCCWLTAMCALAGSLAGAAGGLIGQVRREVSAATPKLSDVAVTDIVSAQSTAKGLRHDILAFLLGTSAGAGVGLCCVFWSESMANTVHDKWYLSHNLVLALSRMTVDGWCGGFAVICGAVAGGLGTLIPRPWAGALLGALGLSLPPLYVYALARNAGRTLQSAYFWLLAVCVIVGAVAGAVGGLVGKVRRRISAATRE